MDLISFLLEKIKIKFNLKNIIYYYFNQKGYKYNKKYKARL